MSEDLEIPQGSAEKDRVYGFRYLPLYNFVMRTSMAEHIERDALRAREPSSEELEGILADPALRRQRVLQGLAEATVRSVAYYRLSHGSRSEQTGASIFARMFPGLSAIEFWCPDIGPGLRIAHGFASVLGARRIGRDCTIHHHVTLGTTGSPADWWKELPILGDRVWIWPNAMVVGPVTVGDGAVIGAGAIVLNDVPAGAVVVGAPARIVSDRAIKPY